MKCANVIILMVLLALGVATKSNASGSNFVVVGAVSESGCDFNSIQAAVDGLGPGQNWIRVSTHFDQAAYYENVVIDGKSLVLWGGYESCSDAQSGINYSSNPNTYVNGGNNGPTFKLINGARVDIYDFEITGGHGVLGGGIEAINSSIRVLRSEVHSNAAVSGGGIYVAYDTPPGQNDPTTFELRDSVVIGNVASHGGGGIYCSNGKGLIDGNSGVSANQATGTNADGGGLYLSFCDVEFFGGTNSQANPIDVHSYNGMRQNTANRHGGGAMVVSSSLHMFGAEHDYGQSGTFGSNLTPMNIQDNVADADGNFSGNGGGIYAIGQMFGPTFIIIENGLVSNNTAHNGGAVYTGFNTSLKVENFGGFVSAVDPCWSTECSVVKGNKASNGGGAFFVEGGSTFNMHQTHVFENRADFGSVLSIDSTQADTTAYLAQNLIYHNGRGGVGGYADASTFNFYNNSGVIDQIVSNTRMLHNTIADNHNTQSMLVTNGVHIFLDVLSSILNDSSTPKIGDFYSIASQYTFDCVNTNNSASLASPYTTQSRMDSSDPGFVVRNYDYHLKHRSAVEDYCDDSQHNAQDETNDIDNDTRAVDNTGYQDLYGAWDLGADEVLGPSDVIFIDRFDW
jgi:predicted outer membrane repeat protein